MAKVMVINAVWASPIFGMLASAFCFIITLPTAAPTATQKLRVSDSIYGTARAEVTSGEKKAYDLGAKSWLGD